MKTQEKIKGLWWLPTASNEKWVGTLTIDNEHSLRLKFTVPEGYCTRVTQSPDVIHGVNSQDKPITLLFPGWTGSTRSAAFTEYKFIAGYAILGFHLKNASALRLNKATLSLPYVYDWVGRTGFKRSGNGRRGFTLTYTLPKALRFKVTDNLNLEIRTSVRSREGGHLYEVKEATDFRLSFRKAVGLREILDLATAFRGLIHFSTMRPVHLKKLEGNKNRHGTKYREFFLPEDVDIISDSGGPDKERDILPQEFIFTRSDVGGDLGIFFKKWIDYEIEFKDALGRYYTTVYHSQTAEERHLSITRALDAYYGIKYNQRDLNDFPKKIRELATRQHQYIQKWEPKIDDFVEKVKATRHFHTHYNPKWQQKGNVKSGSDLVKLNTVLRIIFQCCVLEDTGISSARFQRLHRQMPSVIMNLLP
jgi:hypothetical protein